MKKIYMRAGMAPTELFSPYEVLTQNILGANVGNLLYQYSVCRTLYTQDTEIITNRYRYNLTDKDIARINEECSCFVIPLADAFRDTFVDELRKITAIVKKLTIPCVVVGVGLRAPFEPKLDEGFKFDNDVKEFVKAVLEKSSMLGLRGEITSEYLTTLGFKEGRDHTVIGCPSLYAAGRELIIRDTTINQFSKISVNSSSTTPYNVQQFTFNNAARFQDSTFIPQIVKELSTLYSGKHFTSAAHSIYPSTIADDFYKNNKIKYFLNAFSWFDFLKTVDLSFGSRLHGTIAGLLSGTPSIVIPKDARIRELSAYHNMNKFDASSINPTDNILDLIEGMDFKQPCKVHAANFDHFIDFLEANGLEHIYKEDRDLKVVPYDYITDKCSRRAVVKSIVECNRDETIYRLAAINKIEAQRNNAALNKAKKDASINKAKVKECDGSIKKLKATNSSLEKKLSELQQSSQEAELKASQLQAELDELKASQEVVVEADVSEVTATQE